MSDESSVVDRNDPALKYLTVEKNQFNDPATQAEWTQKRLVWVPHESQVRNSKKKYNERRERERESKNTQHNITQEKHSAASKFFCG